MEKGFLNMYLTKNQRKKNNKTAHGLFCFLFLFDQIVDISEETKFLFYIRKSISFFFCLWNISEYCFLFVWKANKVKVGE